jgi:hypothetical protein
MTISNCAITAPHARMKNRRQRLLPATKLEAITLRSA